MSHDDFAVIIEEKQSQDNLNEWLSAISELRANKYIPCKIILHTASIEQIKAYIIKDNVGFGQDVCISVKVTPLFRSQLAINLITRRCASSSFPLKKYTLRMEIHFLQDFSAQSVSLPDLSSI